MGTAIFKLFYSKGGFMRLIKLIVINSIAWFTAHIIIASLSANISDRYFQHNKLFKTFKVERSGDIWNELFKVKKWKSFLPDGSILIKHGYNKSELPDFSSSTINKFIIEMRRAEFTHWISMLPAPLFFLFNPRYAAWINVLYALISNFPFIITQRYNRPKLEKIYHYKQNRK